MKRTFQHTFRGGRIKAVMGAVSPMRCEWEGSNAKQPSENVYPEYMEWCHSVTETIVNETGSKLMWVFELPGELEVWLYEPGKPSRVVETIRNPKGFTMNDLVKASKAKA